MYGKEVPWIGINKNGIEILNDRVRQEKSVFN